MEEDIETVIDRLQAFVKANKRVSLKKASDALALPPAQVERLALLLEESGLVQLDYKVSGIFLKVSEEGEATTGKKAKASKKGKSPVLEELEALEREVLTAGSVLDFMEKDLERRIALVESLLADLEKKPRFTASELTRLKKEVALILQQAAVFQDEVKRLESKEEELNKVALAFNERVNSLESRVVSEEEGESEVEESGLLGELKKFLSKLFGGKKKEEVAGVKEKSEGKKEEVLASSAEKPRKK